MRSMLLAVLTFLAVWASADHDSKTATDKGSYVATAKITGSSIAGTAFLSADIKRMDAVVFNNTSSTIFVGTTSLAIAVVDSTHSNILIGVPILSSATFSPQGILSDNLYFTCNSGVATCEVRVLEGKNR